MAKMQCCETPLISFCSLKLGLFLKVLRTINMAIERMELPLVEAHLVQLKILGSWSRCSAVIYVTNVDSCDIHVLNIG